MRRRGALVLCGLCLVVLGVWLTPQVTAASASFGSQTSSGGNQLLAGSWVKVFYLKANGNGDQPATVVLNLGTAEPTMTTLPNLSTDLDGDPGRLQAKGGGGPLPNNAVDKEQHWTMEAASDLVIDGRVQLSLWAAIKDLESNVKYGRIDARLYDCAAPRSSCSELGRDDDRRNPWGTTPGFREACLDFGVVEHTIVAGRYLHLHVFVHDSSGDDMWLAYDTVDYPSQLIISDAISPHC